MDIVSKFEVKFWPDTKTYYCKVQFPDNTTQELSSKVDMTYAQWQQKIKDAWVAHTTPKPKPEECQCPECKSKFVCPNRTV